MDLNKLKKDQLVNKIQELQVETDKINHYSL
jgi:hypothetical protein